MIPLYDTISTRRAAVVTKTIVVINVIFFINELSLGKELERFLMMYGVVPARYTRADLAEKFSLIEQILPFFTSMFLHGGFLHLILNMWMLWIFGDNVESRFGRWKYLIFYVAFGLAGGASQILSDPDSVKPMIGASGAIAGVMGAYFVMFPHARVVTAVPIFLFITLLEIPAPVFFAFWFILQIAQGAISLSQGGEGGVAWWAHIGGFIVGMAIGYLNKQKSSKK